MARATGMSQTAISRIWRAFELSLDPPFWFRLSGSIRLVVAGGVV
jgi:hypothetical protein